MVQIPSEEITTKEIKYFTLFTLFYLVSLQKGSLFGKDYLDFFKWNKPDHLSVVKPDIDTILRPRIIPLETETLGKRSSRYHFASSISSSGLSVL